MKKPTTTGPNGVFSYLADIMGLTIAEKLLFVSTPGLYLTLKLDNYLKPEAVLLPREEVTAEPRGRARYCRTALCVAGKDKSRCRAELRRAGGWEGEPRANWSSASGGRGLVGAL